MNLDAAFIADMLNMSQ